MSFVHTDIYRVHTVHTEKFPLWRTRLSALYDVQLYTYRSIRQLVLQVMQNFRAIVGAINAPKF